MMRVIVGWLVAVLATTLLGSIIQTQVNLARIAALTGPISWRNRIDTTLFDMVSFGPTWLMLMAPALLLAFLVAGLLARWLANWRQALFLLAGLTGVAATMGIMAIMLPVTVLAAARDWTGFILMALSGVVGAWLYIRILGHQPNQN